MVKSFIVIGLVIILLFVYLLVYYGFYFGVGEFFVDVFLFFVFKGVFLGVGYCFLVIMFIVYIYWCEIFFDFLNLLVIE